MPIIKIRLRINKPGNVVPIPKVVSVLSNFNNYLESLGEDIGIGVSELWQMSDATQKNQKDSIAFSVLSSKHYDKEDVERFSEALYWPNLDIEKIDELNISQNTVGKLIKLTDNFEDKDKVKIGIFKGNAPHPSLWTTIDKEFARKIEKKPIQTIEFYGDIQGVIKSFAKEKTKNKCKIQELIFNSIVDCEFDDEIYSNVVKLLERKDAIVNAYGLCTASKANGRIKKIVIEKIVASPRYVKGDLEGFRGCYPELQDSYSVKNLPKWLTNE